VRRRAGTRVHWTLVDERAPFLPAGGEARAWLSAAERAWLDALRTEKRRRDWQLGRLAAKHLLAGMIAARWGARPAPAALSVERQGLGAPVALASADGPGIGPCAPGDALPLALSISHSHGRAFCGAVWRASAAGPSVGVDLERIEPRADSFLLDFLSDDEVRDCLAVEGAARDRRVTLSWSAKEAIVKALGCGLAIDTRRVRGLPAEHPGPAGAVCLEPPRGVWRPLRLVCDAEAAGPDARLTGVWGTVAGFVATVVVCHTTVREDHQRRTPTAESARNLAAAVLASGGPT
jgi:phosphopantetheinyl transferase